MGDDPQSPAEYVSWDDAQELIKKLNATGEGHFRLPSEAECEYACRAGSQTRFSYGDDPDFSLLGEYAWHRGNARDKGEEYAHRVGQKRPNAWGLHDMHGNAAEWTRTARRPYPYREDDGRNAAGAAGRKVVRGGSWSDRPHDARSARRLAFWPYQPVFCVGFRVLCEERAAKSVAAQR